jgi:hypothetical protein
MPKQAPGWWRDYFHDHPEKDTKGSAAWTSNSKLKVYCKECWVRNFSMAERDAISSTPEDIAAHCKYH